MQLLERFCRDNDIVFIFDEVQANFGRTGQLYAFTHYGVEPDIVVLGKGLGNGVAVSAAVGRADLFAAMHYGEASDTWSANPLSSAAVLATLDEFEEADVLSQARALAEGAGRGPAAADGPRRGGQRPRRRRGLGRGVCRHRRALRGRRGQRLRGSLLPGRFARAGPSTCSARWPARSCASARRW